MRIAVDAMGGDHAPREIIRGIAAGLRFLGDADELHIFGPRARVEAECRELDLADPRVRFTDCTQIIQMDDKAVEAVRTKRDSGIVRMATAAGRGEVDAVISAGNTGAFVAACQLRVGTIPGVTRPGIAVVMPTFHGPVLICDVGANVDPKPHHLFDYARMCACYARAILKIENPRVGVVSIGEEEAKGNELIREARALIKQDSRLNFVGNAEGRDIFAGGFDIFICDGFVGNVILKLSEGLAEGLCRTIINEIEQESVALSAQFKPIVQNVWRKHDFAEYGGAPLLGLNSVAIICHGRSDQRAISNAIRVAVEEHRLELNRIIAAQLAPPQEAPA
ncbi:MAG: phosphate acyltransferase PlsX [Phycisphaerae bacterium]